MKNVLLIGSIICVLCALPYAIKEGARRQAVVDCHKAKEICTEYWNVHGGNCTECREMKRCQKDGILE